MRLPLRVLRILGLVVVCLVARVGYATPITYNEAMSGDLGGTFPATVFTLDIGANTVAGTTSFGFNGVDFDFDNFAFVVPVGTLVTGIAYTFTTTTGGSIPFASIGYLLGNGNIQPVFPALGNFAAYVLSDTSPLDAFGSDLPLGAGTYALEEDVAGGTGFTTNYKWTLDVAANAPAATPEPAAICLLGTGLIGVGLRRYRNRRRKLLPIKLASTRRCDGDAVGVVAEAHHGQEDLQFEATKRVLRHLDNNII